VLSVTASAAIWRGRLQEVQLIGELGGQAADIVRTQGELNGLSVAKKAHPEMSAEALKNTPEYRAEMAKYGTGSDLQRGIQAATAALQGLSGGDMAGALAGGAAPYLAEQIKKQVGEDNIAANTIAHAILGGMVAELSGNNGLSGAAGAAAGEIIARQLYPDVPREQLSEEQKQTISTLATLAAGLAGGMAGDGTAGAATGAQAGKNAVENNYLSPSQIDAWSAEMKSCQASGGDCGGIIKKYEELSTAQQQQLISDCAASPTTCQQKYGNVLTDSLAVKQALDKALGEDIPAKMAYDLTATWMHQIQADGVVSTNKVSEALQKEYGLDNVQADIIAGAAAAAFGGITKAGKGSAIPVPAPTKANNGLVYKSNPKHTAGQSSNRPNAGIEPQDSLKLFEQSIPSTKQYPNKEVRFAVDSQGSVHHFVGTNGEYHWNGSTADKNPLTSDQIPTAIQKQLGVRIK